MNILNLMVSFIFFNQVQAANCNGDLSCYFTPAELNEALGDVAQQAANAGILRIIPEDPFHDEQDGEETFEDLIQPASLPPGGNMPHDRAPIWGSFIGHFKACAPGCIPARYGTFGRRGNKSCHPSGRAVDVGAIICRGTPHMAIKGGQFTQFASCMSERMHTLYRNGRGRTAGHHDHAHFSNGCMVRGKMTY